jgi:uncharacterized protein (TIGR03435 family)
MTETLMRVAMSCVRGWTRLYTWRMPASSRERRRKEIEADLWECRHDATGSDALSALHVARRLLIGIPDDLGWRVEQAAAAGSVGPRSIRFGSHLVGAVVSIGAFWVIGVDASRPLAAQSRTATADVPTLEVVSIKPNPTGRSGMTQTRVLPGGRFILTNMQVRLLIGTAYRVQSYRLIGGPSWIERESFDIVAKVNAELTPTRGQRPFDAALKELLATRFKLVVHTETKQLPIYELVRARSDGRLGPNLTLSPTTDCAAILAQVEASAAQAGGGPPPPPPPGGQAPLCGAVNRLGLVSLDSAPIPRLAAFLSGELNRSVVDRTGLAGLFNARLTWTPDPLPAGPLPPDLPAIDPNGPSIFTAVQEQLGLRLQPSTGPVEVLVIDSVQHPSPN